MDITLVLGSWAADGIQEVRITEVMETGVSQLKGESCIHHMFFHGLGSLEGHVLLSPCLRFQGPDDLQQDSSRSRAVCLCGAARHAHRSGQRCVGRRGPLVTIGQACQSPALMNQKAISCVPACPIYITERCSSSVIVFRCSDIWDLQCITVSIIQTRNIDKKTT